MTPTPNKPTGNELLPYSNLTNGNKVCSAHELMIKVLDKQDRKLDEIDLKLDQLLTDKAIQDKEEQKEEKKENKHNRYLDIGLGSFLTFICLICFELIKYFTVL